MSRQSGSPEPEPSRDADEPGYGIRAVAQMTGIDEHTLRIWERRYGFPDPQRSPAGTRLYTSADVRKLRLVAHALERGHRPGEVVHQPVAALEALLDLASAPAAPGPAPSPIEPLVAALGREDVDALRAGLRQLALLHGPRRFVVEVAHPLALKVGQLWQSGALEVHQEHLMTDCLSTQLRLLRSLFDDTRGPVVLLTTLPDERHGLGLDMIGLYLAAGGATPRVIGVSTPPDQIVRAARAHQAAVVGIAVMPSANLAAAARDLAAIAKALPPGVRVWAGGAAAPALPPIDGVRAIATFTDLDAALLALLADRGLPVTRVPLT